MTFRHQPSLVLNKAYAMGKQLPQTLKDTIFVWYKIKRKQLARNYKIRSKTPGMSGLKESLNDGYKTKRDAQRNHVSLVSTKAQKNR